MTVTVIEHESQALVAGLRWELMTGGKTPSKKVLLRLANDHSAKKLVIVNCGGASTIGMFAPLDADFASGDDARVSSLKRAHSLAAAFSRMMGDRDAVLIYVLPGGQKTSVVVLEAGLPVLDEVRSLAEANKIVSRYMPEDGDGRHAVYGNTGHEGTQPISTEELAQYLGETTQLTNAPVNVHARVGIAVAVVVACAAAYLYQNHSEQAARRLQAEQRKKADPLPKYRAAVQRGIGSVGVDREELLKVMNAAQSYPLRVAGWNLTSVECHAQVEEGACISTWKRDGGTTTGLTKALAPNGLSISEVGSIDEIKMLQKVNLRLAAGPKEFVELHSLSEGGKGRIEAQQIWANAGISLAHKGDYRAWPEVGVDHSKIPRDALAMTRAVEVDVPPGMAGEIVRSAPPDVWWSAFSYTVNPSKEEEMLKVFVKGASYVRQ